MAGIVARIRNITDRVVGFPVPWHAADFHVIITAVMIAASGTALISPALPAVRDAMGVSNTEVGLLITVFTFPGIVFSPVAGLLADRFGRRTILVPLLLLFGVAGSAIAFTSEFRMVLAYRFLHGVGAAGITTLTSTLIGDFYDGQQRDFIMGLWTVGVAISASFSPFMGGVLADVAWNLPFLPYGVAVLVGIYALWRLQEPDSERNGNSDSSYLQEISALVRGPILAIYLAVFLLFLVLFGVFYTLLPLFLDEIHGLSGSLIGIGIGLSFVTMGFAALLTERLALHFGYRRLVIGGIAIFGVCLLGVATFRSIYFILGSIALFGIGIGIAEPSYNSLLSELSPDRHRAAIFGIRTSVMRIGSTIGPVLFPFVALRTTYEQTVFVTGIVLLVVGIGAVILVEGVR